MGIEFNRYAQEGNAFLHRLANNLGHEDDIAQAGIILRSVLHVLRDRLTIGESLNLLAQLPMFLKAVYVENWRFSEKPSSIRTLEEFADRVKEEQKIFGERRFNWEESTIDICKATLCCLGIYISDGEKEDIIQQLPADLKELFYDCEMA